MSAAPTDTGRSPRRNQVLIGDATARLGDLPDASIDMVLTSPPYFRLRDYDVADQIGLETHVDDWIERLADVSRQVARVLVPTGSYWLNLGDTYATHLSQGAPRKSLLMAPERLALRLQRDGWIIRNKLVWAKTNPMPTSVRDRLSATYEVIYVLVKQPSYFFDLDAIRQPHRSGTIRAYRMRERGQEPWRGPNGDTATGLDVLKAEGRIGHPLGKNPGDVWHLATSNYRGAIGVPMKNQPSVLHGVKHHATFPQSLAERCILAGCPEARCVRCRLPWRRRLIRVVGHIATRAALAPTCDCQAAREPGLVLDPFIGSGTTAVAAAALGRDWCGIELNPDFAALAEQRITAARAHGTSDPRAGPSASAA